MHLVTAREMQLADRTAISSGIPGLILMEHAGSHVARIATEYTDPRSNITIIAGRGNNGGDGFVAARLLHNEGYRLSVICLAPEQRLSPDAKANYIPLTNLDIDIVMLDEDGDRASAMSLIRESDLIIDAILGTGTKGRITGLPGTAIELINKASCPVISVDLPSGLDADTGQAELAVTATCTVTFAAPKRGLMLLPGRQLAGRVIVADIGLPPGCITSSAELVDLDAVRFRLPRRSPGAHKGTCGRVLIIAGAPGYTGAAVLSSMATLRSGSGLCYLAAPSSVSSLLENRLTEVITVALDAATDGSLSDRGLSKALALADGVDVVAIGPGLTRSESVASFLQQFVSQVDKPLVIDADGLAPFEGLLTMLGSRAAPTIITPHIGELARLCTTTTAAIASDLIAAAVAAAAAGALICVAKGASTVIAGEDKVSVYSFPNSGLATAGSGDILTGIIAALIAQGAEAYDAAVTGVYLHGAAGALARQEYGARGMIAGDVLKRLPDAINSVEDGIPVMASIEEVSLLHGSVTKR